MVVEGSHLLEEKNTEVTTAIFDQVVTATKQQVGDASSLTSTALTTADEINNKLRAIRNSKDIPFEKPVPLGTILQTTDAYGYLLIVPVSSGGTTVKTLGAAILMRMKNRLLFACVYGADDDSTLKWIRTTSEEWSHKILAANSSR